MIQKRYEFIGPNGKEWTEWFNYSEHDGLLKDFQTKEKYQLTNPKLLNEFRLV